MAISPGAVRSRGMLPPRVARTPSPSEGSSRNARTLLSAGFFAAVLLAGRFSFAILFLPKESRNCREELLNINGLEQNRDLIGLGTLGRFHRGISGKERRRQR